MNVFQKKQWTRIGLSLVAVIIAVLFLTGVIGGKPMTYQVEEPLTPMLQGITDTMAQNAENSEAEEKAFVTAAQKMLKSYVRVSEINDDISHMLIYVDEPQGKTCHEIVMLITWPNTSIIVFHGDFTEDSLRRMDEISKKQRAEKSDFHKGIYRNSQIPD